MKWNYNVLYWFIVNQQKRRIKPEPEPEPLSSGGGEEQSFSIDHEPKQTGKLWSIIKRIFRIT